MIQSCQHRCQRDQSFAGDSRVRNPVFHLSVVGAQQNTACWLHQLKTLELCTTAVSNLLCKWPAMQTVELMHIRTVAVLLAECQQLLRERRSPVKQQTLDLQTHSQATRQTATWCVMIQCSYQGTAALWVPPTTATAPFVCLTFPLPCHSLEFLKALFSTSDSSHRPADATSAWDLKSGLFILCLETPASWYHNHLIVFFGWQMKDC